MKYETHPVKVRVKGPDGKVTGSSEVGTATYKVYDSVGEAIADIGDAATLVLINAQARTNELNRVRGENRPGALSKTALRNKAIALMTESDWMEVAQNAGDAGFLERKLAQKADEVTKSLPQVAAADEDDDN